MHLRTIFFSKIAFIFILALLISTLLSANPSLIFADSYDSFFKKCTASPTSVDIGQEVRLEIETKQEMQLEGEVVVSNGETKNIPLQDTSETTVRTVSLSSFSQPGTYQVQVRYQSPLEPMRQGCFLNAAFTVSSSVLRLEAPASPITQRVTTIFLVISGLRPGIVYNVKLSNWKGTDLANHNRPNSNDWTADGTGKIIAQDVCNDGHTHDPNCTDPFGDQLYGLDVYEKGGRYIDSLSFEVRAGSGGTAGQNPCVGNICNTALGPISTNPGEFAQKILNIAIGLAGGIALILMVIGSIRVLTSSGDQQRLAGGRDMIVAAIAGLLFLIFSVLILRFIGIQILDIF